MKKMFLLFSHRLSEAQIEDARGNWGVDEFISLPSELQQIWSNVNPDLEVIEPYLMPVVQFVESEVSFGDLVLIQGDFGACYRMVQKSFSCGAVPVYATTKRMVEEVIEEGRLIKKSKFEHRRFREYGV